jgi:hypothetical protein
MVTSVAHVSLTASSTLPSSNMRSIHLRHLDPPGPHVTDMAFDRIGPRVSMVARQRRREFHGTNGILNGHSLDQRAWRRSVVRFDSDRADHPRVGGQQHLDLADLLLCAG